MPSMYDELHSMISEYDDIQDKALLLCNLCKYIACAVCLKGTELLTCSASGIEDKCTEWKELLVAPCKNGKV